MNVLHNDKSNAYAANGLANILVEMGHLPHAEDVLVQVRELAPHVPDVWINLGNVNLLQGHFDNAIRIYESALKEFYGGTDPTLFVYIAKAAYESGKFDLAKVHLQKAIHICPWESDWWYDLAITLKSRAEKIRQDPSSSSSSIASALDDYNAAIMYVYYYFLKIALLL